MKKTNKSCISIIFLLFLKYCFCAGNMVHNPDTKNSEKTNDNLKNTNAHFCNNICQQNQDILLQKKQDDIIVDNIADKNEKLAIFKLQIFFDIIRSCKKIHDDFIYKNIDENEYETLIHGPLYMEKIQDERYQIYKKIYHSLPSGYMEEFINPISTYNLLFCFSNLLKNFVVRTKNKNIFERVFGRKKLNHYEFFTFSYQFDKITPWQSYFNWKMIDEMGVQSLTIKNGIISIRSDKLQSKIEDIFEFEDIFYEFTIKNIPTYLFVASREKMKYVIDRYVINDVFISPKFISHRYKIIGFLVHNAENKSVKYYRILNNMLCFTNNGMKLNAEIIKNPDFDIYDNNGDVVFMLEKIEN